jgi:hypothetical protein
LLFPLSRGALSQRGEPKLMNLVEAGAKEEEERRQEMWLPTIKLQSKRYHKEYDKWKRNIITVKEKNKTRKRFSRKIKLNNMILKLKSNEYLI